MTWRAHFFGKSLCLLIGLSFALAPSPVRAADGIDIFTGSPSNMSILCRGPDGNRSVDPLALAQMILDLDRVPLRLMDKANPEHVSDGSVTRSEQIYAVATAEPFGGNLSAADVRLQDRLALTVRSVASHLALGNGRSQGYVLVGGDPESFQVEAYFQGQSQFRVSCLEAPDKPLPEPVPEVDFFAEVPQGLVVRGTIADLNIARPTPLQIATNTGLQKFAAASQFNFSYSSDREADSSSFETSGTIGYSFPLKEQGALGLESFIPFVSLKNVANDPDPDIGFFQPGILATGFIESEGTGQFAMAWTAAVSGTYDYESDSELYQVSIEALPEFPLSANGFSTGQFNRVPSANIRVRPQLSFIASGQYVNTPGSNAQLVDQDSFFSVGGRVAVAVQPEPVGRLSDNLTFSGSYLYLSNSNGRTDVDRFETSLSYAFPRTRALSLNFSYVNGRDRQTLIDEERFEAGFGLKF